MGHSVPTASSAALSKRQRRKTFKVQRDTPAQPSTSSACSLAGQQEPQNCVEQLHTSRSFRGDAAQQTASNNQLLASGCPIAIHGAHAHTQMPVKQAAATTAVHPVVVQPTLGLAAASTSWLPDSVRIVDRVSSLLRDYGIQQVAQNLQSVGYSQLYAQRACLELHSTKKPVDVESCVQWMNHTDPDVLNRPLNPLDLLKYQDISQSVTSLQQRVPGINQQTAQIAIQQTLGDEEAAAAFLNAAMSKSHMPSSGDPNTMASLLLQNLPPGFNLPANSGEVVQAMATAMAKASELQLATDRLAVAAIQSQQQIKAAMVSGQLAPCSEAAQSTEASAQLATSGSAQSLDSWQKEKQKLSETVAVLEKHKDWADKKIGQLIKRVTDAERPQKDEAYRLRDEVQKLRQEKDVLEGRLKDFDRSLQKLKDHTYQEANQKREWEKRVQAVQADLRGANLREQELQLQVEQEASSAKAERKKRETAERLCKQAVEDKASIASSISEHGQQVSQLQAAAKKQGRMAEERLQRAEQQIAYMAQAKRELDNKCEVLMAEKASIASGLEAKERQMGSMQQEHTRLQDQLLLCQERCSHLQTELQQAQQALAVKDQQTSFYSHWSTGIHTGILFDSNGDARSQTSTSPSTPLATPPHPPTSANSSQEGVRSPAQQPAAQASPTANSSANQLNLQATQPNFLTGLSSVMDSFQSPSRSAQLDQSSSLIHLGIGARSLLGSNSPSLQKRSVQSPIGSQMLHRKSNSIDGNCAAAPASLKGFGSSNVGTSPISNKGGKPSPRPQRAQQPAAVPSSNGPIAHLLGLNSPNGSANGDERGLRATKTLQYVGSNMKSNRNLVKHLSEASPFMPHGMHQLANGNSTGMPWIGQHVGDQMNDGNEFGFNGSQGISQHADAFQRQLHLSNSNHSGF